VKKIFVFLLCLCGVANAQTPITEAQLDGDAIARIVGLYNSSSTARMSGDMVLRDEINGSLALLDGVLTLSGHVLGDLTIINGSLVAEPGAIVDGQVVIVGGNLRGADNLTAASVTWYRDRIRYELRDGVLMSKAEALDELSAGRQFGRLRTDIRIAARGGYNRSEGLPVFIGPRFMLNGSNPTILQGQVILRSAAAFRFDDKDYGYLLRFEQFVGGKRVARVGVRYSDEVQPIETSGLSDKENSITTFVLHRDYRDHYNRKGWAAFLAGGRTGLPLDWSIEYGDYRFSDAALRDPYSIRNNPDPWRPEVSIPYTRLHVLSLNVGYDTRNEPQDPSTGWLIGLTGERATMYHFGAVDVRRFIRFSPVARLSVHAFAGGTLDKNPLPAFRQLAFGGPGSLPGYEQYRLDCGAHDVVSSANRYPYHGCDRASLFQIEYQSAFWLLNKIGARIGHDFGLLENVRWVAFLDAGRAHETGVDAGFGVKFNQLGAYWAKPLNGNGGFNFFMRLGPRI
jgi:hypothetical protein